MAEDMTASSLVLEPDIIGLFDFALPLSKSTVSSIVLLLLLLLVVVVWLLLLLPKPLERDELL